MKPRKKTKYPAHKSSSFELNETVSPGKAEAGPMIRTQIYLNKDEYDFVQREASRRDEPMAAIIRGFIDEKMEIPEDAWTNNPMLTPAPHEPDVKNPRDLGINLDHYLYGVPRDYIKVKGKYIEAPPLPDDYYENRASRDAYDRKIRRFVPAGPG